MYEEDYPYSYVSYLPFIVPIQNKAVSIKLLDGGWSSLLGQYCGSIKLLHSCDKWVQKLQQNRVLILNFKSHL